jgi:hypothetical protein
MEAGEFLGEVTGNGSGWSHVTNEAIQHLSVNYGGRLLGHGLCRRICIAGSGRVVDVALDLLDAPLLVTANPQHTPFSDSNGINTGAL